MFVEGAEASRLTGGVRKSKMAAKLHITNLLSLHETVLFNISEKIIMTAHPNALIIKFKTQVRPSFKTIQSCQYCLLDKVSF